MSWCWLRWLSACYGVGCAVTCSALEYPPNWILGAQSSCLWLAATGRAITYCIDVVCYRTLLNRRHVSNHTSVFHLSGRWKDIRDDMFGSSKLSADEMLPRREQNSSGTPRFPLNLIRTYNQIFNPRDLTSYYHLAMLAEAPIRSELTSQSNGKMDCPAPQAAPNISSMDYRDWPKREWKQYPYQNYVILINLISLSGGQILAPAINPCLSSQIPRDISGLLNKRHRGEKKAIPEEQKDGKYFERRKRNNEAAKRSRDARKLREDRVSWYLLIEKLFRVI